MDYYGTLNRLHRLPDFERTGEFADRPDLAPMRALLAHLGEPQGGRATAHVAGSKGKGSTAAMIEAVLRAAGLRTGFYSSPHLHRYNERIRIDGEPLAPDEFARALNAALDGIDAVGPLFPGRQFLAFDALTAAAFIAFPEAAVDVQIVEVGLGGTLDSTNVFHDASPPPVVVLTPISLEHTAILGSTIPEIAAQKAGIITQACVAVTAPQRESALDVFRATARERGARLAEVADACRLSRGAVSPDGQQFKLKTPRATYDAHLPLAGRHQLDNAATAVLACEEITGQLQCPLEPSHVRDGLKSVKWPARLETLKRKPLVIIDGAHNADSAKRLAAALREHFGVERAVLLFGTLAGKDIEGMVAAMAPIAEAVVIAGWDSVRAAEPAALVAAWRDVDAPVIVQTGADGAYDAALAQAGERGTVVAFGALAFVAQVREHVLGIESDRIVLASTQGRSPVD